MITAVTGASGYVGSRVTAELLRRGIQVRKLGRRPAPGGGLFSLGEAPAPGLLAGADALIHCAYDFRARGWEDIRRVNVLGSERLFAAAKAAGVGRVVFVSTVSAFAGCTSLYGRGKLMVEEAALAIGGTVLRPGLVYGDPDRGMFGALLRVSRFPLLPVLDGGRQPMVLAHADDLAGAVADSLQWDPSLARGPIVLAHHEPVFFADILGFLSRAQGRRLRTFSIPGSLAETLLWAAEKTRIPLRFSADNLAGLLHRNPSLDFSGAQRLDLRFRRFLDADQETLGLTRIRHHVPIQE